MVMNDSCGNVMLDGCGWHIVEGWVEINERMKMGKFWFRFGFGFYYSSIIVGF